MNSNQRSQGNNQTDNGSNEKSVSSSRGGTVQKDNLNPDAGAYAQSGTLGASQQQGGQGQQQSGSDQSGAENPGEQRQEMIGQHQGSQMGQQSTDRTGSQTGAPQQGQAAQRESNDAAGGYPRSPGGGSQLAADQKMDDDTGFSNTANRQSADAIDDGSKQELQSNVGRRSDMTAD